MHNDSKLIFEAFMKSRPADYEDQLDKKEAYKQSLMGDKGGSHTRIGRLEQMGVDFTSNETQQMINNIAQICHTLITGGGAGKFSGIELDKEQLPYIEKIADIIVEVPKVKDRGRN